MSQPDAAKSAGILDDLTFFGQVVLAHAEFRDSDEGALREALSRYPLLEPPEGDRGRCRRRIPVAGERQDYEELRASLALRHVRLVVWIAKQFMRPAHNLQLVDLVQEGFIGLMWAIDRFDPNHGNEFSTYATWWIRQAVIRAIKNRDSLIRIPMHVHEAEAKQKGAIPWNLRHSPLSLSLLAPNEMEVLLAPVSAARTAAAADLHERERTSLELRARLEEVMQNLTFREREIINMRFGLDDGHYYTLEEIGDILQITRERVRQIQENALAKLRHPKRARVLARAAGIEDLPDPSP